MRLNVTFCLSILILLTPGAWAQVVDYSTEGQPMACRGVACDCLQCGSGVGRSWFGGVEYLAVRPHFSEAVAFAEGQQTPTSIDTQARKIDFDYESGYRGTLGFWLPSQDESLQASYTYLNGEANESATWGGPGQFIVDPFGNLVGAAVVVNPSDARFGTLVTGGDAIATNSTVRAHIVDFGYSKHVIEPCFALRFDAGARFAEIDQNYQSIITLGGAPFSDGQFSARFVGMGPRLGLMGSRGVGYFRRLELSASTHGSLLVGNHDTQFSNSVPLPFVGSQGNTQSRTIPVWETQLSANWHLSDGVMVRAGWLFNSWFDLGVSGGTFGGFFGGADDTSTMSFDGLFVGVEIKQ